jgi:hypothetical protein
MNKWQMVLIFVISSEHCTEAINASKTKVDHFTRYFIFYNVDCNSTEYVAASGG